MSQLIQSIKAWIEQPDFKSHDDSQSAFYIQVVALIMIFGPAAIGISYAFAKQWNYVIYVAIIIFFHCAILLMVRRKYLKPAIDFFLIFTLAFLTYGILSAGGIHATGSVLYPLLLIFASLFLDRKSYIAYFVLCVSSVGLIVFAEYQHITQPYIPDPAHFPLFFAFSLMILGSALLIRFITESLQDNLRKTRQHGQELVTQKEILDRVGQAVVACYPDDTIFYWNKAASDYYGWSPEEALGKKYNELMPVSASPETLQVISTDLRTGVWSGELLIQKRDGTFLPTLSTLAPLRGKDGEMSGWVGIAADISERKQVEETLRESEDRFKSVFDYSVIGKSVTRPSGQVEVNRAFCEMVGYSPEELQNRKWQEFTHPEDIELTQREINTLLSGEKNATRFNKRFIHKNGPVVWVDLSSTLRRDKDGKPLYLMTSLVDITERKRAEEALRESEARFHGFFSHSMDSMFLVGENGRVVEINPAAENLFQLQHDEALGKPIWDIQLSRAPENAQGSVSVESIRVLVEDATRSGQAPWLNRLADSVIQLPGGEIRHIQQTSFAIPHGDKFRIASINRDVTEQKRAEAFRVQAEAELRTGAMRQRLFDFSRELLSTVEVSEILEVVRRTTADLMPHEFFSPYWADEVAGVFRPVETRGRKWFSEPLFQTWVIPFGQGIMGDVAHKQQAECVNNSHLDPRSIYPPEFREQISIEHSIFLPIRSNEKMIGMLVIGRRSLPPFTPDEFEMAQLLMSLAELALNNARMFADLEQRVAERTAQLATSEERYRLISTVSSDYIFSTRINDQGQPIMEWATGAFERITGYTFDEYAARGGWAAALHPEDSEQDIRDMATLQANQPATTEVRTITKNGQVRWVRVYAHPVWDAGKNRLAAIYGAVQDITERKQVEVREAHRGEMLEKVIQLGKAITHITDLEQCLVKIHQSVQKGLGFDRVGLFLYDRESGAVKGTLGTGNHGEIVDNSSYSTSIHVDKAWEDIVSNSGGFRHLDDYQAYYNAPMKPDMQGVKEHIVISTWAGDLPVGFIAADNLLTQNPFRPEQIEALQLFAGYAGLAVQNARWNEGLEKRVEKRTAELESANRELESLSYTIGHDLRSPIRAIVAYSHMLSEDLSGRLETSHENKLQQINQVSSRMGRMVDDFLTFLMLGRTVVQKQPVDVKLLVERVIEEFNADTVGRKVEFSVLPMPACVADINLLKDVYLQLVSNALKFTTPRSPARIEIGAIENQGETCYFVRDNGVGFDMKYADKLFGVFQRLHHVSEFDGTGAGLAIVQRIIERHGGRIWAEAEADKGAAFYFTLGSV